MRKERNYSQGGVGILGLLGLLFIGLKLTGYIDWSWWWVTMPFWGMAALLLIIGCAVLLIRVLVIVSENNMRRLRARRAAKAILKSKGKHSYDDL